MVKIRQVQFHHDQNITNCGRKLGAIHHTFGGRKPYSLKEYLPMPLQGCQQYKKYKKYKNYLKRYKSIQKWKK